MRSIRCQCRASSRKMPRIANALLFNSQSSILTPHSFCNVKREAFHILTHEPRNLRAYRSHFRWDSNALQYAPQAHHCWPKLHTQNQQSHNAQVPDFLCAYEILHNQIMRVRSQKSWPVRPSLQHHVLCRHENRIGNSTWGMPASSPVLNVHASHFCCLNLLICIVAEHRVPSLASEFAMSVPEIVCSSRRIGCDRLKLTCVWASALSWRHHMSYQHRESPSASRHVGR